MAPTGRCLWLQARAA